MNKHVIRIVAFLLVPVLLADPATAGGLAIALRPPAQTVPSREWCLQGRLQEEALSTPLVSAWKALLNFLPIRSEFSDVAHHVSAPADLPIEFRTDEVSVSKRILLVGVLLAAADLLAWMMTGHPPTLTTLSWETFSVVGMSAIKDSGNRGHSPTQPWQLEPEGWNGYRLEFTKHFFDDINKANNKLDESRLLAMLQKIRDRTHDPQSLGNLKVFGKKIQNLYQSYVADLRVYFTYDEREKVIRFLIYKHKQEIEGVQIKSSFFHAMSRLMTDSSAVEKNPTKIERVAKLLKTPITNPSSADPLVQAILENEGQLLSTFINTIFRPLGAERAEQTAKFIYESFPKVRYGEQQLSLYDAWKRLRKLFKDHDKDVEPIASALLAGRKLPGNEERTLKTFLRDWREEWVKSVALMQQTIKDEFLHERVHFNALKTIYYGINAHTLQDSIITQLRAGGVRLYNQHFDNFTLLREAARQLKEGIRTLQTTGASDIAQPFLPDAFVTLRNLFTDRLRELQRPAMETPNPVEVPDVAVARQAASSSAQIPESPASGANGETPPVVPPFYVVVEPAPDVRSRIAGVLQDKYDVDVAGFRAGPHMKVIENLFGAPSDDLVRMVYSIIESDGTRESRSDALKQLLKGAATKGDLNKLISSIRKALEEPVVERTATFQDDLREVSRSYLNQLMKGKEGEGTNLNGYFQFFKDHVERIVAESPENTAAGIFIMGPPFLEVLDSLFGSKKFSKVVLITLDEDGVRRALAESAYASRLDADAEQPIKILSTDLSMLNPASISGIRSTIASAKGEDDASLKLEEWYRSEFAHPVDHESQMDQQKHPHEWPDWINQYEQQMGVVIDLGVLRAIPGFVEVVIERWVQQKVGRRHIKQPISLKDLKFIQPGYAPQISPTSSPLPENLEFLVHKGPTLSESIRGLQTDKQRPKSSYMSAFFDLVWHIHTGSLHLLYVLALPRGAQIHVLWPVVHGLEPDKKVPPEGFSLKDVTHMGFNTFDDDPWWLWAKDYVYLLKVWSDYTSKDKVANRFNFLPDGENARFGQWFATAFTTTPLDEEKDLENAADTPVPGEPLGVPPETWYGRAILWAISSAHKAPRVWRRLSSLMVAAVTLGIASFVEPVTFGLRADNMSDALKKFLDMHANVFSRHRGGRWVLQELSEKDKGTLKSRATILLRPFFPWNQETERPRWTGYPASVWRFFVSNWRVLTGREPLGTPLMVPAGSGAGSTYISRIRKKLSDWQIDLNEISILNLPANQTNALTGDEFEAYKQVIQPLADIGGSIHGLPLEQIPEKHHKLRALIEGLKSITPKELNVLNTGPVINWAKEVRNRLNNYRKRPAWSGTSTLNNEDEEIGKRADEIQSIRHAAELKSKPFWEMGNQMGILVILLMAMAGLSLQPPHIAQGTEPLEDRPALASLQILFNSLCVRILKLKGKQLKGESLFNGDFRKGLQMTMEVLQKSSTTKQEIAIDKFLSLKRRENSKELTELINKLKRRTSLTADEKTIIGNALVETPTRDVDDQDKYHLSLDQKASILIALALNGLTPDNREKISDYIDNYYQKMRSGLPVGLASWTWWGRKYGEAAQRAEEEDSPWREWIPLMWIGIGAIMEDYFYRLSLLVVFSFPINHFFYHDGGSHLNLVLPLFGFAFALFHWNGTYWGREAETHRAGWKLFLAFGLGSAVIGFAGYFIYPHFPMVVSWAQSLADHIPLPWLDHDSFAGYLGLSFIAACLHSVYDLLARYLGGPLAMMGAAASPSAQEFADVLKVLQGWQPAFRDFMTLSGSDTIDHRWDEAKKIQTLMGEQVYPYLFRLYTTRIGFVPSKCREDVMRLIVLADLLRQHANQKDIDRDTNVQEIFSWITEFHDTLTRIIRWAPPSEPASLDSTRRFENLLADWMKSLKPVRSAMKTAINKSDPTLLKSARHKARVFMGNLQNQIRGIPAMKNKWSENVYPLIRKFIGHVRKSTAIDPQKWLSRLDSLRTLMKKLDKEFKKPPVYVVPRHIKVGGRVRMYGNVEFYRVTEIDPVQQKVTLEDGSKLSWSLLENPKLRKTKTKRNAKLSQAA